MIRHGNRYNVVQHVDPQRKRDRFLNDCGAAFFSAAGALTGWPGIAYRCAACAYWHRGDIEQFLAGCYDDQGEVVEQRRRRR